MWSESCGEAPGTCRHLQTAWGENVMCVPVAREAFCVSAWHQQRPVGLLSCCSISWDSLGYRIIAKCVVLWDKSLQSDSCKGTRCVTAPRDALIMWRRMRLCGHVEPPWLLCETLMWQCHQWNSDVAVPSMKSVLNMHNSLERDD